MKKILCVLQAIVCVLSLFGCSIGANQSEYQVSFYYPRVKLNYGQEDGVISSEMRDVQDRSEDLSYIIRLYLSGPAGSEFYSPFSEDVRLVSLESVDSQLHIVLDAKSMSQNTQLQNTLAYASLAKTCLNLTDYNSIHINTQQRIAEDLPDIIFTRESLIFWDDAYAVADETTAPQSE